MEMTTMPMSNDEIVENLKTMMFGKQAYERFNAKERETLDKAWNLIDQYENRLKADMVAMLKEVQDEIFKQSWRLECICDDLDGSAVDLDDINKVIQQKINSLKEA